MAKSAEFRLPSRPTPEEMEAGLSRKRKRELLALAAHLEQHGSLAAAAAAADRSEATYKRCFSDMARAAGWTSVTPEDYLSGDLTRRGPKSSGAEAGAHLHHRVRAKTKELFSQALGLSGLTADEFLSMLATKYLAELRSERSSSTVKNNG